MRLLLFLVLSVSAYGQILAPILQGAPAGGGGVTIAKVGTPLGACVNATKTLTLTQTLTAGNYTTIGIVEFGSTAGRITSVKDNNNNALSLDADVTVAGWQNQAHSYWSYKVPLGGATSIIITAVDDFPYYCGFLAEWSTTGTTFTKDVADATGATGSGTTWLAGAITPTASKSEVILGTGSDQFVHTVTGNGTWTLAANADNAFNAAAGMVYQIVSSTSGSYQPGGGLSVSDNYTGLSISYKAQ